VITTDNFSGLTILSYNRGMMGEFFGILLQYKLFNTNIDINSINKFKNKDSESFGAWAIDKTFNCIVDTDYHFINNFTQNFQKDVFGKGVYGMIQDKEYELARSSLIKMVNLNDFFNGDYEMFCKRIATKNYKTILNLLTDDYASYDVLVTRSHNYTNIDFTECFTGCTHINFYTEEKYKGIFFALYFFKKIKSMFSYMFFKTPYAFWNIESIENFIEAYEWIWKNPTGPIKNAININVYDILVGKLYPEEFMIDDTKDIIIKNNKVNINLLNSVGIDLNKGITKSELLNKLLPICEELIKGNLKNELGRSY
jgi:hypothetical protein